MDLESIFNTIFLMSFLRKMTKDFHFGVSFSFNGKSKCEFKIDYRNDNN